MPQPARWPSRRTVIVIVVVTAAAAVLTMAGFPALAALEVALAALQLLRPESGTAPSPV